MPEIKSPIDDAEAEEWVERMMRHPEDLGMMATDEDWDMYVEGKLYLERGQLVSDEQRAVLSRGRSWLQQGMAQGGFSVEHPIIARPWEARIRDLTTGRFTTWGNVQKEIVPFRPLPGFIFK